jgi:hypothetical protein
MNSTKTIQKDSNSIEDGSGCNEVFNWLIIEPNMGIYTILLSNFRNWKITNIKKKKSTKTFGGYYNSWFH